MIVIATLRVLCCVVRLQACTNALCIEIFPLDPGLSLHFCWINRIQSVHTTNQSITTPMHCFLFPVHGSPPNDIDVKRLPSTSSSSSPVGHLVDLYLSCNPVGQSGRTFFFSSTEIPPGPTLTSSKRPPTIAIHQFRPRRSREVTYREFGNCKVSFGFLSAKIRAYKSYLRKSR